ncbi:MAG: 2TM domain-containing protein [Phycisphaerae bacterium]|nr:2TM domain-containing protein [Phycisphaerae bacterium]
MPNEDAYNMARKRVNAKIGLYIHGVVYVVVNVLLFLINLLTSRETLWFIWPLMGWGIGLLLHATIICAFSEGAGFKQRMIEKEMRKLPAQAP